MNRRVVLVTLGVVVLLVVAWWTLLWQPVRDDIEEAGRQGDAAQQSLTDVRDELAALQGRLGDLPSRQARLLDLALAVPDDAELGEFLLELTKSEELSGITFLDVQTSPAEPFDGSPSLGQIEIEVTASGGYFQVLDFVNRLARLDRIYVVDGIELVSTAVPGETGPPRLEALLTGRIFVLADEGSA